MLNTSTPLCNLIYSANPQDHDAAVIVQCDIQPLYVIFQYSVISELKSFFTLPAVNQALSTAAWDQVQILADTGADMFSSRLQATKQQIEICISAPTVVLPMANASSRFEFNFGRLEMRSAERQKDNYENYDISVSSIQLTYFSQEKARDIVQPFAFNLKLGCLSYEASRIKYHDNTSKYDEMADVIVSGVLPKLFIQLDPEVYQQI